MTASWWRQESPIGTLTVLAADRGVQQIELAPTAFDVDAVEGCDDEVALELEEYFTGRRRRFTMPVDLSRIDAGFPRTVYETLRREVGWGETVSYGELAEMAGRPRAALRRGDQGCVANGDARKPPFSGSYGTAIQHHEVSDARRK